MGAIAEKVLEDPKREKIIDAAEQLFIANGFAATSMEDVARAARASKRTIYTRFRSKEDLFAAVMLSACRDIDAPALDMPDADASLEEALRAAGQATLFRVLQPRGLAVLQVAIGEKSTKPQIMKIYWENGPGYAEAYVRDAIARFAKRKKKVSAKQAALRFMNMIFGPFLYTALFADTKLPSRKKMNDELDATIEHFIAWLSTD
ncbi:TetR/AcrR family transcriptional regulator [Parasphingopyxis sp.]|uniref:TetR/AcrR family transcriptional regulator n=1 Tax=Parasphingopyxis sp. TaxID=1920299 RepID=UPI002637160C|nr:TetR/AcrR family transcriptional regulator [Parasphingopyxis sp.]